MATKLSTKSRAPKDTSPTWKDCANWSGNKFTRHYYSAMEYYRLEFSGKDMKPAVIKWMASVGCTKEDIAAFKSTKDNRCNITMGAVASCLLRGMTPQREDFNKGRSTAEWLLKSINEVIEQGKHDVDDSDETEVKSSTPTISIQERVREASYKMTEEIENALYAFNENPDVFDPKAFKVLNLLKAVEAKAAHARIIKEFYNKQLVELLEVPGTKDEQLKEGYGHLSKANLKKITNFYQEVVSACDMLAQEAKVNRAPRAKKPTDKSKVVAKLKYLKTFEPLKLVSVSPTDIIGAKELWVYNIKTRKLGKYVAAEYQDLGVKGTTLTGFSEDQSICKTLRKPEEKLKEFKSAGKVQLRKFLDEINATDTKMNGRINEETMLLKVQ